jgi:hypothetical protein
MARRTFRQTDSLSEIEAKLKDIASQAMEESQIKSGSFDGSIGIDGAHIRNEAAYSTAIQAVANATTGGRWGVDNEVAASSYEQVGVGAYGDRVEDIMLKMEVNKGVAGVAKNVMKSLKLRAKVSGQTKNQQQKDADQYAATGVHPVVEEFDYGSREWAIREVEQEREAERTRQASDMAKLKRVAGKSKGPGMFGKLFGGGGNYSLSGGGGGKSGRGGSNNNQCCQCYKY